MFFNKYRLEDITDKIGDGIHGTPEYDDNGDFYFVNGNNLVHGDIVFKNDTKRINEEQYLKNKRDLNKNTLLVSINGTLGNVAKYNNEKIILGKSACYINVKDEYNVDYVYFVFESPKFKKYLQYGANGTTIKNVPLSAIRNYEISIPSKENQDKIVKILKSIEDKIKLNNKINNNLYELSQKIYNRWFVDFEYPVSSNQTYKSNGGSFKEADGLVVPDNFIVNKLDEICDCQNGHAFYKEGYDDSGLMVIDLGNVSLQGNFIYTNADKYIDRNRIPNEKFIVKKNDLVMIMTDRKATMDLLGKTAKIYEDKEYALNQRIYRIRPTINVNYVYSFLNSSSILEKLKGLALGSVQKYVNTNHINDLKIVVPSAEIMNEYSKVVDPVFKRMEENILENRNLEIMRDSLLPKLMNGEIDLDNIEI